MKKILTLSLFLLIFLTLIAYADTQSELIISDLKNVAVPIHAFELALALFIGYMSLKFFRITKPLGLFLYIYIAIGFFIISILLYLFMYLSVNTRFEMDFLNVYIGSRVAIGGMLISFVVFFYQWNRSMKENRNTIL